MGRLQQITSTLGLAACVALGGGCIHVHKDAEGNLKSVDVKAPVLPEANAEPGVFQASAKVPVATAPAATASMASLAKAASKDPPKGSATEISVAWQNKVAELPDPTKNGAPIHGVVGQMFLFAADFQPAAANGKLVVEMFDLTPKPGTTGDGPRLGSWTYDKETLKRLVTMDERFGKSYAVFLPWPEYNPNVSRVKLTVKYEPERGFPLYASPSTLTFDNGLESANATRRSNSFGPGLPPGGPITAGFGGITPAAPPDPRTQAPLDPLPVGGRSATGAPNSPSAGSNPLPLNLPPLVITTPNR